MIDFRVSLVITQSHQFLFFVNLVSCVHCVILLLLLLFLLKFICFFIVWECHFKVMSMFLNSKKIIIDVMQKNSFIAWFTFLYEKVYFSNKTTHYYFNNLFRYIYLIYFQINTFHLYFNSLQSAKKCDLLDRNCAFAVNDFWGCLRGLNYIKKSLV